VCQNDELGSETVELYPVRKGTNYTIQVGGAGNAGGPLGLAVDWFPDRDGDGEFDAIDDCPSVAGNGKGGCPPELRATPRIRYDGVAGGIRITSLAIDDVPRGARAEVRCRRCGGKVTGRARRAGVLQLRRFVGREVRNGDRIEVRITRPRAKTGRFRFGAIGKYYRWPVTGDGLGDRVSRCTNPGSRRLIKCPR
jgi:DNA-directed RNA polymerase subunit RPC12/RpoP